MRLSPLIRLALPILSLAALGFWRPTAAAVDSVDFRRDVQPILSDVCFHCHGPDKETREADFRLDTKDGALRDLGGYHAIVPGKPEESEIIKLITATDPDDRMPPPKSGRQLTAKQIEILKRWIADGAKWQTHWAFEPVRQVESPQASVLSPPNATDHSAAGTASPIDAFIRARLAQEKLVLSPEAPKETLIRRLSLDLTGLPPTPREVDDFLADTSAGAYERVVDRLLASPHFGERMAMEWLDAARFADTNGHQTDETRDMSRWREWVINAFNRNQPFDQFTIEQIAGDLLPNPTIEQRVATGFNRNHRINTEGGSIAEEFLVETVVDRLATTGTVWLGLTFECARCHDHKYDPITQRDFYRMFAFFNTVAETGLGDSDKFAARGKAGNSRPILKLATPEHTAKLAELDGKLMEAQAAVKALEKDELPSLESLMQHRDPAAVEWIVVSPEEVTSAGGATFTKLEDGSFLVSGPRVEKDGYTITETTELRGITGVRLELLPDPSLPKGGSGRADKGNAIISEFEVEVARRIEEDPLQRVKFSFATAEFSQEKRDVTGAIDGKAETAWSVLPEVTRPHAAVFEFAKPIGYEEGTRLRFRIRHDLPRGEQALTGRFRISLTVTPDPYAVPRAVAAALGIDPGSRSAAQKTEIENFQRARSPKLREATTRLAALQDERQKFERSIPTTMVMEEMAQPRDTFMLKRGQYDLPGEKVTAGTPDWLPPLPEGAPANRLGLARWIVDPANPLTARVTVNRFWQMLFGTGLVKSVENFGAQADPPSHPELLDWLASEFVQPASAAAQPWDLKRLLKLMVTSETYKQSSQQTRELLDRDPENRLLARGPRLRLSAEMLRDQALALSGLLTRELGGRSVRPYQPAGLWEEIAFDPKQAVYVQDHGPQLYRRSLYMFWKRTVPPPLMTTFDAPSREICVVSRQRTSTPMQALALMNETSFIENARGLAQRMLLEGGAALDQQLAHGFRLATARPPQPAELKILLANYEKHRARFARDPAAAEALLAVGEAPANPNLRPADLAAAAAVASLVLNLDETITRE